MQRTLTAVTFALCAVATAAPSSTPRWEYGVLLFDGRGTYQWALEKRAVDAASPKELLEKLGGKATPGVYLLSGVMNVLGAQGWELVSSSRSDLGQQFFFKRPRK